MKSKRVPFYTFIKRKRYIIFLLVFKNFVKEMDGFFRVGFFICIVKYYYEHMLYLLQKICEKREKSYTTIAILENFSFLKGNKNYLAF